MNTTFKGDGTVSVEAIRIDLENNEVQPKPDLMSSSVPAVPAELSQD